MNRLTRSLFAAIFATGLLASHSEGQTPGTVALTATLKDQGKGGEHWMVAWVTNATTGAYVRTLRRQQTDGGNDSHMRGHLATWASQAGLASSSTNYPPVDGYSTATAWTYAAPNSPFTTTWNCKDALGNTVADGTYKMWIQYAEDSSAKPVTTGMTWTKGPGTTPVTTNFANQGTNFTGMKAVWTPTTYMVTFNASSGTTPSPATKLVNPNSPYGALATTSRTGYTFAGWWTGVGGTGTEVTEATTVTITAAQTLYAKWTVNADPYADWASGLPVNQRGPDQIPQNDGITNLMKYACNLNPLAADVSKLTVGGSETKGLPVQSIVGGKIRMEFLRRKASTNPGITYLMQFSTEMSGASWSGVDVSTAPAGTSVSADFERVIVDDTVGGAKRFGRVKVTQP